MSLRQSTKSDSQKEDEDVGELSRTPPKVKPPRKDLQRHKIRVEDPDLDTKDKDLSMNRKDIGGSAGSPLDAAICLVAMRLRGTTPSIRDVTAIRSSLTKQGATESDLTNPRFYPVLASATLGQLDKQVKTALYQRVLPSSDGRRFEMGPPVLPRDPADPRKPISTKWRTINPRDVGVADHNILVAAAKKLIDKTLLKYNRDVAFRSALDMAISTYEDGKYDHMLDASNYLEVLNKLSNAKLDLTEDTYVPNDVNSPGTAQSKPWLFDPFSYYGKPVVMDVDVHKQEAWKQHFDHPEPYTINPDEPYMSKFRNPRV